MTGGPLTIGKEPSPVSNLTVYSVFGLSGRILNVVPYIARVIYFRYPPLRKNLKLFI